MAATRTIPQAEWDLYKTRLRSLYDKEPLAKVIQLAESDYGFLASKAQYIRQFKKWGFEKNLKSEQWKGIAGMVRKRKSQGKDSQVSIKNRQIPHKKLCKEMSRYALPADNHEHTSPSVANLDAIVVGTPKEGFLHNLLHIEYTDIPWFEFQTLIGPSFEHLRELNSNELTPYRDICHNEVEVWHQSSPDMAWDLPEDAFNSLDTWAGPRISIESGAQWTNPSTQDPAMFAHADEMLALVPSTVDSQREVLSLLAGCVGASASPDSADFLKEVFSHLDDLMIEFHNDATMRNAENLRVSTNLEPLLQLIRYSVYLSSNNLLSDSKTDNLVEWMTRLGTQWVLGKLLDLKSPTTEIFGSNILVSAARLGCTEIVRNIIAKGIEVNSVASETWRETALEAGVNEDHADIVQSLLYAGSDPKIQDGSEGSILYSAICRPTRVQITSAGFFSRPVIYRPNSAKIVQMLIDHGADINSPLGSEDRDTALVSAVEIRNHSIVRILLKEGARVNEMREGSITALQASVILGDIDVTQMLLDAAADVDSPAGEVFADACEAAAECENGFLVQILLDEGADVNASPWEEYASDIREIGDGFDEDPLTALQAAVSNKNPAMIRLLLAAGADVDARGCGETPLQMAAAKADVEAVQILLKHGADVNAPAHDQFGKTALQAAASTGNCDLVQQLLNFGANISAESSPRGGRTTVQAASEHGNVELVKVLISMGADINADASPREGLTCLQAAVTEGHTKLIQLLLDEGADVNGPASMTSDGVTALQAALERFLGSYWINASDAEIEKSAQTATILTLLDAGADINAPPSPRDGISALVAAINYGSPELVRSLLQRGGSPNVRTTDETALGAAVARRSTELISLLIEAGADVDASYKIAPFTIVTALQAAALGGCVQIARLLLNGGAKLGTTFHGSSSTNDKPSSMNALHCAVASNCPELVQFLIAEGANPNACAYTCHSSMKVTPLEAALVESKININIVSILINSGANVNKVAHPSADPPLHLAARREDLEVIKLLLSAGACTSLTSKNKSTALQAAIKTRKTGIIQTLIDAGADVNAPAGSVWGRTALQEAAEEGDKEMVNILLSHGAHTNAPAGHKYGITALQGAAMNGHLRIVLILLKVGARINAPPARVEGRMALEAAAEHGHLDCVVLLLKNDDDAEHIDLHCMRAAELAASEGHHVIARILREHRTSGHSA